MKKIALIIVLAAGTANGCLKIDGSLSNLRDLLSTLAVVTASPTIVAVGDQGKGFRSTDGVNWTAVTVTTDTTVNLKGLVVSGTTFVAVGQRGTLCRIFTSPDGTNWTPRSNTDVCFTAPITSGGLFGVATNGATIVAVGEYNSAPKVYYSTDGGVTWTTGTAPGQGLARVVYDGSNFVATDITGATGVDAYRSTTGTSFALVTPPFDNGGKSCLTGAVYLLPGTGKIVFAGQDDISMPPPASSAFTTNSGTSWTADSPNVFFGNTASEIPRGLAYNSTRLVAVGDTCRVDFASNVSTLNWSPSALTMSACTGGFAGTQWLALEHDGSKFIAVGASGRIAVSATGASTDWSIKSVGATGLSAIAIRR